MHYINHEPVTKTISALICCYESHWLVCVDAEICY